MLRFELAESRKEGDPEANTLTVVEELPLEVFHRFYDDRKAW